VESVLCAQEVGFSSTPEQRAGKSVHQNKLATIRVWNSCIRGLGVRAERRKIERGPKEERSGRARRTLLHVPRQSQLSGS
jgi:hypothetical protein